MRVVIRGTAIVEFAQPPAQLDYLALRTEAFARTDDVSAFDVCRIEGLALGVRKLKNSVLSSGVRSVSPRFVLDMSLV